ncbi:uncharacterized membrane protein YoaK (UPF0700 family) [Conyzicola lurida]|uniref:Uncharacterized membrane protein YoaK (UPF0700 family) n=1 Tax=Conyzicola lurida TaxID=1172621 RepID=A0A841AKM1_9MICO|nr:hypothetical protein [Conyzicola lurida]MBB5843777.1 uncharacterized membrane protein YoaK (UPF0700 family) [Conyzicola lurida]
MTALTVVALFCGAVSLALAVSRRHSGGRAVPVAELVMLAAMLDLHLPPLGMLPAPVWSLLLMGCAIGVAFADRVRRRRGTQSPGDDLHAASMLLAAVLVMFLGAGPGRAQALGSVAHAHGAATSASVILITAIVVAAHGAAVVALVVRRRPNRVETVRRFASLAALIAMAGMTAGPVIA